MSNSNICPICGSNSFNRKDDFLICKCCDSMISFKRQDDFKEIIEKYFDSYKLEQYVNAKKVLYSYASKEIDNNKIINQANKVLNLYPDDVMANFYIASLSNNFNDFLDELDVNLYQEELPFILDFSLKVMEVLNINSVKSLIERGLSGSKKIEYFTKCEEISEKLLDGVYEINILRDVFIAYSSKDIKSVNKIVAYLEDQGVSCFVALRNLRHGRGAVENYSEYIKQAMKNSKCILFLSSENSRQLSCDALKMELPYLRDNLKNKGRIEYIIEDYGPNTKMIAKTLLKSVFNGLEYCTNLSDLCERVSSIITKEEPEKSDNNDILLEQMKKMQDEFLKIRNSSNADEQRDSSNSELLEQIKKMQEELTKLKKTSEDNKNSSSITSGNIQRKKVSKSWPNGDSYDGEMINDVLEGYGVYRWKDGERYEGNWKNNKRNGYGIDYYADGDRYEGDFKDDKRNGKGTYYYAGGGRYEGKYKDDKRNGHGIEYYTNGDRYDGEYKDDKKNGKGKFYWKDGDHYEGEFKYGNKDGRGIYYWKDGERYEGTWENDKRNGYGIDYYADGGRYEGEYKDGKKNGHGINYYANGNRYEGEYKDDKKNEKGTFYWKNGDRYEGNFENGLFSGYGVYYWVNGDYYEGYWKNDKRDGRGTYYWKNGKSERCFYKNGIEQ